MMDPSDFFAQIPQSPSFSREELSSSSDVDIEALSPVKESSKHCQNIKHCSATAADISRNQTGDLTSLDWLTNFDFSNSFGGVCTIEQGSSLLVDRKESETAPPEEDNETWCTNLDLNFNEKFARNVSPNEDPSLESWNSSPSLSPKEENQPPLTRSDICQCTFSCLAFRAIEESAQKALPLQGIYDSILQKYPSFQERNVQWKRGLRHSLSLNKCFVRLKDVRGSEYGSRGCWWTVHPDFRKAFGDSIMVRGPQHRCLPKNHFGGTWPQLKRNANSEIELMALAQDIKTAASIVSLNPTSKASPSGKKRNRILNLSIAKHKGRGAMSEDVSDVHDQESRTEISRNKACIQQGCKRRKFVISLGDIKEDHCYLTTSNPIAVKFAKAIKVEKSDTEVDVDVVE